MIVCVGTTPTLQRSMLFDRVELDHVNRAKEVREYASGKCVNVARVLKALGADAVAAGFAGGVRGGLLRASLREMGVGDAMVETLAPTRLCTTVVDRSRREATELVEEPQAVSEADWEALDALLIGQLDSADAWILSGSLPPGAPDQIYARWAARGLSAGRPVLLDARGHAVANARRCQGLVFKLNIRELAETIGRPVNDAEGAMSAIGEVLPPGGAAVVTLGAQGAVAADGRCAWRVHSPGVPTLNPIGSGDAFAAGLMFALLQGPDDFAGALALASACGAANAMTPEAGQIVAADVTRLARDARVEVM